MDRALAWSAIGPARRGNSDTGRSAHARRSGCRVLDRRGSAQEWSRRAAGDCLFNCVGTLRDPSAGDLGSADDARARGLVARAGVAAAAVRGGGARDVARPALKPSEIAFSAGASVPPSMRTPLPGEGKNRITEPARSVPA